MRSANTNSNKKFSTILTLTFFNLIIGFASIAQNAEKLSICKAFPLLIQASENKFSGIKGAALGREREFASTIEIEGAASSSIFAGFISKTDWIANFGFFDSHEKASEKLNLVKSALITCGFQFINSGTGFERMVLKQNDAEKFYPTTLRINKNKDDKFEVVFTVPEKSGPVSYFQLSNKAEASSVFAKDLLKIISDTKTHFQVIKGVQTAKGKFFDKYATSLCLDGSTNCQITDFKIYLLYEAIFLTGASKADANSKVTELQREVSKALGKKYSRAYDDEGAVLFRRMEDEGKTMSPLIEIKSAQKSNETYNVLLMIRGMDKSWTKNE